MKVGGWPVGRKIYQASKETRNRGRGSYMWEWVDAQLVNMNGEFGDHSHMNAFSLHSHISQFPRKIFFSCFSLWTVFEKFQSAGKCAKCPRQFRCWIFPPSQDLVIKRKLCLLLKACFPQEKSFTYFSRRCWDVKGGNGQWPPYDSGFYSQDFLQRHKCLKSYPWHIIHLFANNFTQKIVTIVSQSSCLLRALFVNSPRLKGEGAGVDQLSCEGHSVSRLR